MGSQKLKIPIDSRNFTSANFISSCFSMPTRPNNRLLYLLDRLERIQSAPSPEQAEDAMNEFTYELLDIQRVDSQERMIIFHQGSETMLTDLVSNGAIDVLLYAVRKFRGYRQASCQFYNNACIVLVHFALKNKARARLIYQKGGFDCIVDIMQSFRSVEFLQLTCIAALLVLGKQVGVGDYGRNKELDSLILRAIVEAMENHQASANIYVEACSALGSLFGPECLFSEHSEDEEELLQKALGCLCAGLVEHSYHEAAQGVGGALLRCMVGPDLAEELIEDAALERYGTHLAAAAA
jgi:hypothetical protein